MTDNKIIEGQVVDQSTGEIIEPAQSTEIIIKPPQDAAQFNQNSALTKDFVKASLVKEIDYGVIPGTKNKTLLQPGAEKLARFYNLGCFTRLLTSTEIFETGFFAYTYECVVRHLPTGIDICRIERSCNSYESKYLYENVYPNKASEEQKARTAGTTQKTGKNGEKYTVLKVRKAPDELAGDINTYQSMAQKRAIVAGVRQATMATDLFRDELAEAAPNAPTTKEENPVRVTLMKKLFATAKEVNPLWKSEYVSDVLYAKYQVESLTQLSNQQLQDQIMLLGELQQVFAAGINRGYMLTSIEKAMKERYGVTSTLLLTFAQLQESHALMAAAVKKAEVSA